MMKTTIALILAWGVAKLGYPVAFFSLEMPANQLRNKIVSLETGIDYHDLKKGRISSSELGLVSNVNKKINELQFFIIEDCKTIEEIAQRTNELVTKFSVKLGVLDYIQRCKISKIDNLREGTTKITRELKSMAKDNYIPIIALSQLSRAVESRTNKRPILSDLKESGSIEEDADIVIFPFRQAYYNLLENRPVPDNEMWKTELNIGKGRDIGTAHRAIVDVNPVKMTITDWQPFQVVKKS